MIYSAIMEQMYQLANNIGELDQPEIREQFEVKNG